MTVGDRKDITITNVDKMLTYCSIFSNVYNSSLKNTTSTTPDAPPYYQEFVWVGRKSKEDVVNFVTNWAIDNGVVIATWEKKFHIKHINTCRDEFNKRIEVWSEFNYNAITSQWNDDVEVEINNSYILSEGFSNYTNIFGTYVRWLGSYSTTGLWIEFLYSDYPAQYKVVNLLE